MNAWYTVSMHACVTYQHKDSPSPSSSLPLSWLHSRPWTPVLQSKKPTQRERKKKWEVRPWIMPMNEFVLRSWVDALWAKASRNAERDAARDEFPHDLMEEEWDRGRWKAKTPQWYEWMSSTETQHSRAICFRDKSLLCETRQLCRESCGRWMGENEKRQQIENKATKSEAKKQEAKTSKTDDRESEHEHTSAGPYNHSNITSHTSTQPIRCIVSIRRTTMSKRARSQTERPGHSRLG